MGKTLAGKGEDETARGEQSINHTGQEAAWEVRVRAAHKRRWKRGVEEKGSQQGKWSVGGAHWGAGT